MSPHRLFQNCPDYKQVLLCPIYASPTHCGQAIYRVTFKKTSGVDYACLTEIEFAQADGTVMDATYLSASSCFGCVSCTGCNANWGNAPAALDGVSDNDTASQWWCTSNGTFSPSGEETIMLQLPERPVSYTMARPRINEDWVATDWVLEEQQHDQSWLTLSIVTGEPKALRQHNSIQACNGYKVCHFIMVSQDSRNACGLEVRRVSVSFAYIVCEDRTHRRKHR